MRVIICILQKYKNRAFLAENGVKMPKNQYIPFVKFSLKSATSQNFPNFFTNFSTFNRSIVISIIIFALKYYLYCFL